MTKLWFFQWKSFLRNNFLMIFFHMFSCDFLQIDFLYAIENVQSMFRNFLIHRTDCFLPIVFWNWLGTLRDILLVVLAKRSRLYIFSQRYQKLCKTYQYLKVDGTKHATNFFCKIDQIQAVWEMIIFYYCMSWLRATSKQKDDRTTVYCCTHHTSESSAARHWACLAY